MRKAKVAIARKIAVILPSIGGSRNQSDIYSQAPDTVCRTGDVRRDGVEATLFIRLVAARPYSAANVEAPDPDIIMRRRATSDHDPSEDINQLCLSNVGPTPISTALAPSLQS